MKNLPGIVKVRKTSFYTQVHSHPIQQDLEDLRSIGLLAYVQSMSEDFVLPILITYLDNIQKKSAPVSSRKTELVPDWFPARNHQKVEPEDKTIDFDLERQKILAKSGQSEPL